MLFASIKVNGPATAAEAPSDGILGGEHILERQVAVALERRPALHRERRRAELRARTTPSVLNIDDVGEERREQLVVDERSASTCG